MDDLLAGLAEIAGPDQVLTDPEVTGGYTADWTPAADRLWAYLERRTESISAAGIPHKLDVALPVARIAAFRAGLDEVIATAGALSRAVRAVVFGRIGAGALPTHSASWSLTPHSGHQAWPGNDCGPQGAAFGPLRSAITRTAGAHAVVTAGLTGGRHRDPPTSG